MTIKNFKFMIPGALHKARWMAKILYYLKIVLLQEKIQLDLPAGSVFQSRRSERRCNIQEQSQIEKLIRFCKFIIAVYVPCWITCGSVSAAAEHDILLLK